MSAEYDSDEREASRLWTYVKASSEFHSNGRFIGVQSVGAQVKSRSTVVDTLFLPLPLYLQEKHVYALVCNDHQTYSMCMSQLSTCLAVMEPVIFSTQSAVNWVNVTTNKKKNKKTHLRNNICVCLDANSFLPLVGSQK